MNCAVGALKNPRGGMSRESEGKNPRSRRSVLHAAKPADEIAAVEQQVSAAWRCERIRKDLRKRLALQIIHGALHG